MLERARRLLGLEAGFVAVLAVLVLAVGYLLLQGEHWRRGVAGIAAALLLAAVVRGALPQRRAGLLAVRGRWRDTICYLVLGGVILGAAIRLH